MRLFRKRSGVVGKLMLIVALVAALSSIRLFHKARKLPVERQLAVLQAQMLETVRVVEDAHKKEILVGAPYMRTKTKVLEAVHVYNVLVKNFAKYGSIASTERERLIALLLSAAQTVKQVKQEHAAKKEASDG